MKLWIASVVLLLASAGEVSAQASDLFFSEYVEGSNLNKAVEIYNGTGQGVDLSQYSVTIFANGSSTPTATIPLVGGILADGAVWVVANPGAGPGLVPDQVDGSLSFTGNDAVALWLGTTAVDVIGTIGADPGIEWGTGSTTTQNHTLRRLASVCVGDADGFSIPEESGWTGFPVDTFDDVGVHAADCVASVPALSGWSALLLAGLMAIFVTEMSVRRLAHRG